jgi:hypothetical protein
MPDNLKVGLMVAKQLLVCEPSILIFDERNRTKTLMPFDGLNHSLFQESVDLFNWERVFA